jgi:hypothetical protein
LSDTNGWLGSIQKRAREPFPEELRVAIIRLNYPVLRNFPFSFVHQMELAIQRDDPVSLNQCVSGYLASYFDILFAINRIFQPGLKRLLRSAAMMATLPPNMEAQVRSLIRSSGMSSAEVLKIAGSLNDELTALLRAEGLT